jgi:hypothetical protein
VFVHMFNTSIAAAQPNPGWADQPVVFASRTAD